MAVGKPIDEGPIRLDRSVWFTYSPPIMVRLFRTSCALFALCCLAPSPSWGEFAVDSNSEQQEDGASEGTDGLLVLRNGNLLSGKILRQQDRYRVATATSELFVRADKVEMFCRSIDEVYQRRRLQRTGLTADSHIELARWCMRNGLLEYAARELLDARTIDPDHRRLLMVQRQLQLALENQQSTPQQTTQSDEPPAKIEQQDLEDVPLWARKLFVRQIQPLLVDCCATSGCHQVGSTELLQINRLAVEGPGHPGTTLRNLSAIMKQVNLSEPEESPLLVHAKLAHGKQGTRPPRALERHQYQMLQTWIQQMAVARSNAPVNEVRLAEYQEASPDDALPLIRQALQEEAQAQNEDAASSDPFDPARFNQQHHSGDE